MRACLAVTLATVCLALCACGWRVTGDPEAEAAFVESLRKVVRGHGEISQFDLAEATTFDWSVAYVFRPYASEEVVNKAVGTKVDSRGLHHRDDINLLIFAKNSEVVLTVEVSRGVCDFVHPAKDTHFRVANGSAQFQVTKDDADHCVAKPANGIQDEHGGPGPARQGVSRVDNEDRPV